MLSRLRGSRTLRIAVSVFVSLVLVLATVSFVSAAVGTVTVDSSSQNPTSVVQGGSATFTVTAVNTSGSSTRGFQATGGRI
jgi:hypothetical protein